MYRLLIVAGVVLILGACDRVTDAGGCRLGKDNYLNDNDFALYALPGRSSHWSGMQHAGEKSFVVSVEDGVASFERIGTQPWFLFRQKLKAPDLAGRNMAFTAELRLRGQQAAAPASGRAASGLQLSAHALSGRALQRLKQALQSGEAGQNWQQVRLVTRLPRRTETVELGFFHELQGTLQVRNAAFREVLPDSEDCLVTTADP